MTRSILKGLACALCLAAGLLTACKDNKKGEAQSEKRTEMEQRAQEFLSDARKSLAQKDFAAARQSIEHALIVMLRTGTASGPPAQFFSSRRRHTRYCGL